MINLRTRQGWEDLKRELDKRPLEVLRICSIDALPRGTIVIDDPRGSGRGNFAIWLKSDGLSWKNYTTDERGRSLELIAYCHGWYDLDKRGADPAANLAIDRLGLGRVSKEQLEQDRAAAKEFHQRHQRDADAESARKRKSAFAVFVGADPILGKTGLGTLAERYLRDQRGVDLRADPFLGPRGGRLAPGSLRYLARHKYVITDRNGRKSGESHHPCMVACCVDPVGQIAAIHQTWLAFDGSDKATLRRADDGTEQKARKVFGDSRGCVIPLWRGEGHYTVEEASAQGLLQTLVLCEGVEDGLSAVIARPDFRVWAAISLSNLANVADRLPACCDSIIVHRQNDWAKPQAVKAFDRAIAALRGTGRIVSIVEAALGKDLNDTLRGAA